MTSFHRSAGVRKWLSILLLFCTIFLLASCSSQQVASTAQALETVAAQQATETSDSIPQTPGSCVATYISHPIPDLRKWYPVTVATSHPSKSCPSRDVQVVELRGWIHSGDHNKAFGADCDNAVDPDWHYALEVDTAWALSRSIDLNQLFRVGNLYNAVLNPSHSPSPLTAVATPLIEMEIWGWNPSAHNGQAAPPGWVQVSSPTCPGVWWPFDTRNPLSWQKPPLDEGKYVRVVGSLVTDDPHDQSAQFVTFICGLFGWFCNHDREVNIARQEWGGGFPSVAGWPDERNSDGQLAYEANENDPARWTEIHPPDLISMLPDPMHHETLREVAVFASACLFGSCESRTADEDIYPPTPCPSSAPYVGFQEIVGTAPGETNFSTIIEGNGVWSGGTNTGARIDMFSDHIHVHVKVQGVSLGPDGRFKALYRVFCTATSQYATIPNIDGLSPQQAVAVARQAGFVMQVDSTTKGNVDTPTVVDQHPAPGTLAPIGASIFVVIENPANQ